MNITEKYSNAINFYFFQPLTWGKLNEDFFEQIQQENNKDHNDELFLAIKSFLKKFKLVIRYITSLFKELEEYKQPKINKEKRNLDSYLSARINNIYSLECSIREIFESLKYTILSIESFTINDKITDAIYLKKFCINKIGYYRQHLSSLGIDLSKTPFLEYFDSFLSELKVSIDIDELKFYESLKSQNTRDNYTEKNIESLNVKQVQKIGLLIRSGIIDYLRAKNPKITNNQIAGFIDLLSKEPLKQTSINPHLSKTNSKYAIQNKQDETDLDLILKQFGISPQSE